VPSYALSFSRLCISLLLLNVSLSFSRLCLTPLSTACVSLLLLTVYLSFSRLCLSSFFYSQLCPPPSTDYVSLLLPTVSLLLLTMSTSFFRLCLSVLLHVERRLRLFLASGAVIQILPPVVISLKFMITMSRHHNYKLSQHCNYTKVKM